MQNTRFKLLFAIFIASYITITIILGDIVFKILHLALIFSIIAVYRFLLKKGVEKEKCEKIGSISLIFIISLPMIINSIASIIDGIVPKSITSLISLPTIAFWIIASFFVIRHKDNSFAKISIMFISLIISEAIFYLSYIFYYLAVFKPSNYIELIPLFAGILLCYLLQFNIFIYFYHFGKHIIDDVRFNIKDIIIGNAVIVIICVIGLIFASSQLALTQNKVLSKSSSSIYKICQQFELDNIKALNYSISISEKVNNVNEFTFKNNKYFTEIYEPKFINLIDDEYLIKYRCNKELNCAHINKNSMEKPEDVIDLSSSGLYFVMINDSGEAIFYFFNKPLPLSPLFYEKKNEHSEFNNLEIVKEQEKRNEEIRESANEKLKIIKTANDIMKKNFVFKSNYYEMLSDTVLFITKTGLELGQLYSNKRNILVLWNQTKENNNDTFFTDEIRLSTQNITTALKFKNTEGTNNNNSVAFYINMPWEYKLFFENNNSSLFQLSILRQLYPITNAVGQLGFNLGAMRNYYKTEWIDVNKELSINESYQSKYIRLKLIENQLSKN
ncbi:MAG: hypothetical protein V1859_04135 [archaeon]